MSSKSVAQRSSPTKRSDNRQHPKPVQRQSPMNGSTPNPAEMQKRLGNQGTQAWLAGQQVQAKLTIGQPSDQYEQEADRTADAVMRMPESGSSGDDETKSQTKSVLQRSSITPVAENRPIQKLCTECEKELGGQSKGKLLQRKENNKEVVGLETRKSDTNLDLQSKPAYKVSENPAENVPVMAKSESGQLQASSGLQQKLTTSKGSGRALPKDTRSSLESSMGADFSNVNIHTGPDAIEMNKELGAQAFTHGSDIYFNQGKYDPSSNSGKHLLAHELTHTVQQGGSSLHTKKQSGEPEGGSLKTDAPNIQAFGIPFTDYETDFSIEGVKNAANIAKDAVVDSAGWVKDKVEEGLDWIYEKISGLVSSGIAWLGEQWNSIQSFASSGFESLKNSFTSIIGFILSPFSFIANAIMSMDAESLSVAWASFTGVVSSVWEGFKILTDGLLQQITEIWEGISGFATSLFDEISGITQNYLFKKLPDAIQEEIISLINKVKTLWNSINDGWNTIFNEIKTWVDSALVTVEQFVLQVTSFAINVVIEGIQRFGHLVLLLKDIFDNPKKYIDMLVAQAAGVFNGLETQFAAGVAQYLGGQTAPAPGPDMTGRIQRQPAATNSGAAVATEAKSSATSDEVSSKVWKAMGDKWHQMSLLSVLGNLVLDLFVPMYGNVKDVIKLYQDIRTIVTSPLGAGSPEEFWTSFLKILDIPILIYNTVVSMVTRTLALALIIAAFDPEPITRSIAAAAGELLLWAFITGVAATLLQKLLLLRTGATTAEEKNEAYNSIADSIIGSIMAGLIIGLVLLLTYLVNVARGIYGALKGNVVKVGEVSPREGKVGAGGEGEGKGKGTPEEGKAADAKNTKEVPSEDGKRKVKINEEGKCEVCASPCDDIRKKYTSQMTPEIEGKIKAIESDASLTDAQKIERLKPIEQKLANIKGQFIPEIGEEISIPVKGRSRATVIAVEEDHIVLRIRSKSASGDITYKVPKDKFATWVKDGEVIRWSSIREFLMEHRPKYDEGVVEKVWEKAKQPDGKVYDPTTGKELKWDPTKNRWDQWHMGHRKGHEYAKLVDQLAEGKITEEKFYEEYNKADNYRPQDPVENMKGISPP